MSSELEQKLKELQAIIDKDNQELQKLKSEIDALERKKKGVEEKKDGDMSKFREFQQNLEKAIKAGQ
mgnify:CR=1 FL=1